jgi:hypothetical protein
LGRVEADREAGVRLHEMAGGQGSPSDAVESSRSHLSRESGRAIIDGYPPARGVLAVRRDQTSRTEAGKLSRPGSRPEMRKEVREFIRRLEAVGLTVESTPGHYRILREGKLLRKRNGMPFTLPFSPDTIR